uniref:hypothetical protein n=1 Tax=Nonomuraea sp. CA-251285 TaxID=3240002 RepID=UPI003F49B12E
MAGTRRARTASKAEPDSDEAAPEEAPPEVEPGQGDTPPEPDPANEPITDAPPSVTATLDAPVSESAPLVAPVKHQRSKAPQPGDTAAAPETASRVAPGPHLRLIDDDGNTVDPDEVFLPQEGPATVVRASRRVYQEYRYPGTNTPVRQLLVTAGVPVPLAKATQMINEIKAVEAETAAKDGPEQAPAY